MDKDKLLKHLEKQFSYHYTQAEQFQMGKGSKESIQLYQCVGGVYEEIYRRIDKGDFDE